MVVGSRQLYVNFLVEEGILKKWLDENRILVINLISSISPNYTTESIKFIKLSIANSDDKNE